MYIVLVYDIVLDGKDGNRVLSNIFKISKKYLTHIQNSVFEGELTEVGLRKLKLELGKYIRKDKDSVVVFQISNIKRVKKEFWGIEDEKTSNFF